MYGCAQCVTTHSEQNDHISTRTRAAQECTSLCLKIVVIHVSCLVPCRNWHWPQAQVLSHLPHPSFRRSLPHTQILWRTIHIYPAKIHGRVADQHKSHLSQGRGAQRWFVCICWPRLRVARISDYSSLTSVLHLCTLEQMRKFMWKCLQVSRVQDLGDSRQQWMERGNHQSTGKSSHATKSWQICFPTERHHSVFLQTVLWQVGLGTARRRFSGVWINIQFGVVGRWIQESFFGKEGGNCELENLRNRMKLIFSNVASVWMILGGILSWIKGMRQVRLMHWRWIIASRWPLLDRKDGRAATWWLKSWIRRNIKSSDQVLAPISVWQKNTSTLPSVRMKSWEREQDPPQPQGQNWRESRVISKDVCDVHWISLGWKSWAASSMWPWMQTGLETQRQGAPRLEECWQSVRASLVSLARLFDIGLWHRQQLILQETLKTPSQHQEGSCAFSEAKHRCR